MKRRNAPLRSHGTRSKEKGRRGEHEVARIVGGKRAPLSGALGGTGDVIVTDGVWADWLPEVKRRKQLPKMITDAYAQAERNIPTGSNRRPIVYVREDNGRWFLIADLRHADAWARALADHGRGYTLRPHLEQIERGIAKLREVLGL